MTTRTTVLLAAAIAGFGALGAAAFQPAAPNVPPPAPPSQPAPPQSAAEKAASRFIFLTGAWSGPESTPNSGVVEETWTVPEGDTTMGMMRWLDEKGVKVCELMTITAEPDAVRLRIRHFDGSLHAKIERDRPSTLKLDKMTDTSAAFTAEKDCGDLARITYAYNDAKYDLAIAVEFNDAKRPSLKFNLHKGDVRALKK